MTQSWPPDREFWTGQFPANTAERSAPHLFKGVVPPSAVSPADVLAGLGALRHAHETGTPASAKVRVYVGEDRHDELVDTVLSAPAWGEDEAFVPWMQALAGADRFSVVINNLETTNPALAAGLGLFLRSLFDGWGVPIGGAEQVAFAGNYAGTAFGVHEGFEDAFLVHLGPGVKNFYCWSGEDYRKLTGGDDPLYGDYAWLLEHGQRFVLEPGDALFLPRRVFHVGTQDAFSVSVAVPLYTYPDTRLLRLSSFPALLDSVLPDDGPKGEGTPSAMHPAAAGPGAIAGALAEKAHAAWAAIGERLQDTIAAQVANRWNTVLSNGGWEPVEHDLVRDRAAAAFDPEKVASGARMRVPAPYRLVPTEGGMFLRGVEVEIDDDTLPAALVEELNTGATVTLPDQGGVLKALRSLGATGGLELTTTPEERS